MITIKDYNPELQYNLYESVIYAVHLLRNNFEFEKQEKYNKDICYKYFTNVNAFDKHLFTDEDLKVMVEQTIPGLDTVLTVDIASDRIRSSVIEITSKLIGKIKNSVSMLEIQFSNIRTKIPQFDKIIKKSKEDVSILLDCDKFIGASYDSKTNLLSSNQAFLASGYRGDLFLNHSVETLLGIVSKITDSLFNGDELNKGRDIASKLDLEGTGHAIKYYIPKSEATKVDNINLLKFTPEQFKTEFSSLPKLIRSDIDGVVDFIQSLYVPDPHAQPDNPATHATAFDNFTKSVMMCWSRASGYFDNNIRPLIVTLSEVKLTPLIDICNAIEEEHKEKINQDESNTDTTKTMHMINCYLKLIEWGVTSYYFDLEAKSYDILRFTSHLDFFMFMKNLACVMYLTFRNKNKEEGTPTQDLAPAQTQGEQTGENNVPASNPGEVKGTEQPGQNVGNAQ